MILSAGLWLVKVHGYSLDCQMLLRWIDTFIGLNIILFVSFVTLLLIHLPTLGFCC